MGFSYQVGSPKPADFKYFPTNRDHLIPIATDANINLLHPQGHALRITARIHQDLLSRYKDTPQGSLQGYTRTCCIATRTRLKDINLIVTSILKDARL